MKRMTLMIHIQKQDISKMCIALRLTLCITWEAVLLTKTVVYQVKQKHRFNGVTVVNARFKT